MGKASLILLDASTMNFSDGCNWACPDPISALFLFAAGRVHQIALATPLSTLLTSLLRTAEKPCLFSERDEFHC